MNVSGEPLSIRAISATAQGLNLIIEPARLHDLSVNHTGSESESEFESESESIVPPAEMMKII